MLVVVPLGIVNAIKDPLEPVAGSGVRPLRFVVKDNPPLVLI
jgi:hypothetical protein